MDVIMGALNWYAALPSSVMVMIGIFLVGLLLARLKDPRCAQKCVAAP
ncbi:hypothetical protein ACTQ1Z_07805 [Parolsenella sp. LCP21S3_E11]